MCCVDNLYVCMRILKVFDCISFRHSCRKTDVNASHTRIVSLIERCYVDTITYTNITLVAHLCGRFVVF